MGLGRLIAGGRTDLIEELHRYAADPRWRVRETVAMALQRVGDDDPTLLFDTARRWTTGRPYVQRAAVAAVAEPRLLKTAPAARAAIDVVDAATHNLVSLDELRSDEVRTLRQALAYCWSVVVVADLEYGKPRMERWAGSPDPDVRWLLRENLKKNRLVRADPAWVDAMQNRLAR